MTGRRGGTPKLTPTQVREMRRRRRVDGESLARLAAAYGVAVSRVSQICSGSGWASVAKEEGET